jgi:hypothetical protein
MMICYSDKYTYAVEKSAWLHERDDGSSHPVLLYYLICRLVREGNILLTPTVGKHILIMLPLLSLHMTLPAGIHLWL